MSKLLFSSALVCPINANTIEILNKHFIKKNLYSNGRMPVHYLEKNEKKSTIITYFTCSIYKVKNKKTSFFYFSSFLKQLMDTLSTNITIIERKKNHLTT